MCFELGMIQLRNDFEFQADYVHQQVRRLLSLQDQNPLSSSYGCFHLAYWRDKTSEFPDARFQEAASALLLLSHPKFYRQQGGGLSKQELVQSFSAALVSWQNQQHRDGSFDEWYKHEHGFAATAFTLIALGLAVYFTDQEISGKDREIFERVATSAADWLCSHEDLVKYNHQMAGAAALAIAGTLLKKNQYFAYAKKKYESVLRGQNAEGWFTEIAGMDLGYCFVLLDYAGLYRFFSGDHSGDDSISRLLRFALSLVQPDLTISPEAGICLNPYVSRLGIVILSDSFAEAAELRLALEKQIVGWNGISPTMADDLRLCRWSHLPLAAELFREKITPHSQPSSFLSCGEKVEIRRYPLSNLVRWKGRDVFGLFLPCSGGLVRVFVRTAGHWQVFEDEGYHYRDGATSWAHGGYDQSRPLLVKNEWEYQLEVSLGETHFVFPGFISRLGLRLLGAIPGAPFYVRKFIDFYRKKKKTAINQSVAPVSSKQRDLVLNRRVTIDPNSGGLSIEDRITSLKGRPLDEEHLFSRMKWNSAFAQIITEKKQNEMVIRKTLKIPLP